MPGASEALSRRGLLLGALAALVPREARAERVPPRAERAALGANIRRDLALTHRFKREAARLNHSRAFDALTRTAQALEHALWWLDVTEHRIERGESGDDAWRTALAYTDRARESANEPLDDFYTVAQSRMRTAPRSDIVRAKVKKKKRRTRRRRRR